jgi:hypothetical protein
MPGEQPYELDPSITTPAIYSNVQSHPPIVEPSDIYSSFCIFWLTFPHAGATIHPRDE